MRLSRGHGLGRRTSERLRSEGYGLFVCLTNLLLSSPIHSMRRSALVRLCRATVGEGTLIRRNVVIMGKGGLVIGERCVINSEVVLDGRGGLTIGSDVNISPGVSIWTADHDPESVEFLGRTAKTSIGDRTWISSGATVLPGIVIGTGAVVAAGSVVVHNVPAHSIVGGVPAKIIGQRNPAAQERLAHSLPWFI